MDDLSLHILDVVENSITAEAGRVRILIAEDTTRDLLTLEIEDDGKGMDAETRAKVLDPFYTTRTTRRVGLGLPFLAQAAQEADGSLEVASEPDRGTTVRAVFRASHPDRRPMGDIAQTLSVIVAGRPDLELEFRYEVDGEIAAQLSSGRSREKEPRYGQSDD